MLGEGCHYIGSDGSLRVGNTLWHPDQGWDPSIPGGLDDPDFDTTRGHYYAGIKTGIYLDPVDGSTGCLSVIPGSHISPFHESLGSLHCDIPERGRHLLDDPQIKQFDFAGDAVPHYAIASQPGNVVFFSNMLWHAAFGGRTGRRMFAISFKGPPTNEGERQQADSRKRTVQKMRETAGRG